MYGDHPLDKVRRTQRQRQRGLQQRQRQRGLQQQQQQPAVARLRGCGIFLPMSVVPAEDADGGSSAATLASLPSPASATAGTEEERREVLVGGSTNLANGDDVDVYYAERLLYNGDFYAGTWSGVLPHGAGKYLWIDGCMYEGEWRHGNTSGKGKFSWPSGATYEGEFRCGFMDGVGTYTASSGDTYHGSWTMNLKHGWGKKSYSNGDSYEGEWRRGVQHGRGRYVWSNGNKYTGSWKAGTIHGRGVLTWANGNCYDGDWEGGMPSGKGRFRWVDGSCYVGVWRKGVGVEEGVYHGSRASAAGGREPVGRAGGSQPVSRVSRGMKKAGETIDVGHKNYELMLCLKLGIRHSVGRPAPVATLDLKASSSFDPKEKLWTRFPPQGTKYTPSHQSCEFKWKDYCPVVFRTLRNLFKVDAADYMMSICGNDALRELPSPGKSGSFFYLTHDDRYMIKTIKKSEVKVLLRMLPAYYNHVRGFESTLVTKFFGLHCVKLTGPMQRKVRFIVMGNVFYSDYSVHRRFDLKGSSHGRITDKPQVEIDETSTLKDRDLNFTFWLPKTWFQEFQRQVDRDREFLEREWLMDYSLLVGVHFRGTSTPRGQRTPKDNNDGSTLREATAGLPRPGVDRFLPDPPRRRAAIKLGVNMPARVQHTVAVQRGDCDPPQLTGREPTGEAFDAVLFLGIIDILQDYDIGKRLEHAYKSFQCDPTSMSAVDPKHYSRRFRDFVFKVFREDNI